MSTSHEGAAVPKESLEPEEDFDDAALDGLSRRKIGEANDLGASIAAAALGYQILKDVAGADPKVVDNHLHIENRTNTTLILGNWGSVKGNFPQVIDYPACVPANEVRGIHLATPAWYFNFTFDLPGARFGVAIHKYDVYVRKYLAAGQKPFKEPEVKKNAEDPGQLLALQYPVDNPKYTVVLTSGYNPTGSISFHLCVLE